MPRLFGGHLLSWCAGKLSAARLQYLATCAGDDGFAHPVIARLAGLWPDLNARASLIRPLQTTGAPRLITAYPGEFANSPALPSTWFRALHQQPPHEFRMRLGADKVKLRSFWQNFGSRPAGADAVANRPNFGSMDSHSPQTTPAGCAISVASLVGNGEANLAKFTCASHAQRSGQGDDSLFWHRVLEDLNAPGAGSAGGRAVARDRDGTRWGGALLFVKCDEDARANDFGLARFSACNEALPDCLANRASRPFTDLTEGAAWRPGERVPFDACKARARGPNHPPAASARFCHRFFFPADIVHLLECKGVAPLVFGPVIMRSLADVRIGPNNEQRLGRINERRQRFYDARPGPHRPPKIMLNSCTRGGWENLAGPARKAAKVRGAALFFKDLVLHFCAAGSPRSAQVRGVVAALDTVYEVLCDAPMRPSFATVARARQLVMEFGAAYQRLRELSRRAGVCGFAATPKVHKVQHLPLLTACINPVRVQVYAE
ncbi:unnamed protein product, partial [Prorocentrum cordatum]